MFRRTVIMLSLSGLANASAAEPARPPDWVVTHNARRTLGSDKQLAGLNIGVRVRDGEALVWGPVFSEEQAAEAVARVKLIAGVASVVNELYVLPRDHMLRRQLPQPVSAATRTRGAMVSTRAEPAAVRAITMERPPFGSGVRALPSGLPDVIEDVRRSDARFSRLRVQIDRGTVTVLGLVARPADATEFADRVRPLAGVADVVIRADADRP